MRKTIVSAVLSLSACALMAQTAEPLFVRDAVGERPAISAARLAERASTPPLARLADAGAAALDELEALERWNREGNPPLRNGFTRALDEPVKVDLANGIAALSSRPATLAGGVISSSERGMVWSGVVRVENAHRIRIALKNVNVPDSALFWTWGKGEEPIVFGSELIDPQGTLYTPSVGGEVAYLEIEIPNEAASQASFVIDSVVEIVASPMQPRMRTNSITPADEATCLIDATCVESSILDVVEPYRRAVAHLQYVTNGSAYICTGGLLNDTDESSVIPYMLTADHCFNTQASASSLEAFWDYKTSSCGAAFPDPSTMPRSNGAQMLASSAATDFTFVRLNSIPSGRALLGWDPRPSSVPNGTTLHRISHPFGVPQLYSSTLANETTGTCSGWPRGNYLYSSSLHGGTYGGSSGSPVILKGGYVVGQLAGGCGPDPSAGCDASNSTVDGALSATFPMISSYLQGTSTGSPCVANSTTACLLNGRFKVTVRYRNGFDNAPADREAQVKPVTGFANPNFETAFFYFNSSNNIEMMIKMLDQGNVDSAGRPTIALLFGSATPLRIEVTVVDSKNGARRTYLSEFNKMQGKTDFNAFVK